MIEDIAPLDYSEQLDGPPLIAVRSEAQTEPGAENLADNQFHLGTRVYDWHSHRRGQVFCVESGLIQVRTNHGSWLLPPQRAGWVPPGQAHQIKITGAMSGWSILLNTAASAMLPDKPCVISVNELMRALVTRMASWTVQEDLSREQENLSTVLFDELRQAPHEALHLPLPDHKRLQAVTAAIQEQPGNRQSLPQLAQLACMSVRNMSRLFQAETGMSIGQWRQQAELLHALERLAQGEAVGAVADALGYATASNFISMFRRHFGLSPARYFNRQGQTW